MRCKPAYKLAIEPLVANRFFQGKTPLTSFEIRVNGIWAGWRKTPHFVLPWAGRSAILLELGILSKIGIFPGQDDTEIVSPVSLRHL